MWKQRIIQLLWILAGTGTLVLLVAAMQKKAEKFCSNVEIEITGATEHVFVDEKDIKEILKGRGSFTGVSMARVDLRDIEEELEKDPWIKNAELFFDNKRVLQVRITEREPVARIFTTLGNSFYLDSSGKVLPLSEKLSARVPVFTNFPFGKKLSGPDSALLKDVLSLSNYIYADSFWNAQIAQIDITGDQFEMVPVIGDHIIRFGNVSDMDKKFKKLFSFYKNVSTSVGFDKYEIINVEYDGQVVATRRGAAAPVADSANAMQQLQNSLETMQAMTKDTVQVKPVAAANANSKPVQQQRQPKAVMRKGIGPQRHSGTTGHNVANRK
jgi:cell division protein FtsQ